jgi:hypothetical protein
MKNSFILLTLFASLSLVGCKKNDENVSPIESPVTTLLKDTATVKMGQRSSGPWELGLVFSASVPGKISQIGSRMPQPGSYRILIWDFDTRVLLRQKTVEQSTPGAITMANLDEALPVLADKKYVISINTQSAGEISPTIMCTRLQEASYLFQKGTYS